jgi:hypothetical protein
MGRTRLTFLLLLLLVPGCGYRSLLAAPEASERSDARPTTRLAVMALRNDSPEPWLDRILTDAMRREMTARGRFTLVNDPSEADLVLRGRIRPLDIRSKSFSSFVAALEYALTLTLDLEVVRAGGDVIRLDPSMLSETDAYLASADIEVTRTNRLELLRRLSDQLAVRVADSLELMQPSGGVPSGRGDG